MAMVVNETDVCKTSPLVTANNISRAGLSWISSAYVDPILWERVRTSPGHREFMVFLLVATLVLGVAMVASFAALKSRYQYTRVRLATVPVVLFVGITIFVITDVVPMLNPPDEQMDCGLSAFLSLAIAPFIALSVAVRFSAFLLASRSAAYAMKFGRITAAEVREDVAAKRSSVLSRARFLLRATFTAVSVLVLPFRVDDKATPEERMMTLLTLRFVQSGRGTVALLLLVLLPFMVVSTAIATRADPVFLAGCRGCSIAEPVVAFIIFQAGAIATGATFLAVRCYHLHDPFHIIREGVMALAPLTVSIAGVFIMMFAPPMSGAFDWSFITLTGMLGALAVQTWLPLLIAQREQWMRLRDAKSSDDAASSGKTPRRHGSKTRVDKRGSLGTVMGSFASDVSAAIAGSAPSQPSAPVASIVDSHVAPHLDAILKDAELAKQFEAWLTSEFAVESLLFLRDVGDWIASYFDLAPSARTARARRIERVYLDPDVAVMPINISDRMNAATRARLHGGVVLKKGKGKASNTTAMSSSDDVPVDAFDEAKTELSRLLEQGPVFRFRRSPLYERRAAAAAVADALEPVPVFGA